MPSMSVFRWPRQRLPHVLVEDNVFLVRPPNRVIRAFSAVRVVEVKFSQYLGRKTKGVPACSARIKNRVNVLSRALKSFAVRNQPVREEV